MSGPRPGFEIGGTAVAPGTRATVDLPVSVLSDHTPVTMSVHAVHGKTRGPVLFVSAAVHGDEVIGVEIVRRLLRARQLGRLSGTLIAVPIVNAFGFLNHSRYLPDRRDLNRSFPGTARGSLAARLAHLFTNEILARSDFGIDLHSATVHRANLPQIRVSASAKRAMDLAMAFGAPVVMTSRIREGSMREAARAKGVEVLVYEAGEGLRFDEFAVRTGVIGILRVMAALGMISEKSVARPKHPSARAGNSTWVRAPAGGLLRSFRGLGDTVKKGAVLGAVSDPFGEVETEVSAPIAGLIVGRSNLPVVNEGDGLFHLAEIDGAARAEKALAGLAAELEEHPLFDEDEII